MTVEETGVVMDILRVSYPRFYAGPAAQNSGKFLRPRK